MKKSLFMIALFAIFSAVSFAQDGLIAYEAPSSVAPGTTVTIDVNYTSAVDCDLIVYFRNDGLYASPTRFSLTAGTDVTTPVEIVIDADAPLGDGYEYAIFLTETGGEWGTKIGNGINTPASVIEGLIAYEAPSSVVRGSTVTIDVNYTSAVDCDLIVYFRNNGVFSSPTRFSLTAGNDVTTPVEIVIDADAPLGDGYEYAIFLTETGGEWGTKIGNGINTPASVIEGLIAYEAPSSVAPGTTVTIDVNYTSAADCDLIVYFRNNGVFSSPTRFSLTAGTDVTTPVEIVIDAEAPLGDGYEYAIFLTETGGEWGTRIGNGINTPASVVAGGLIAYEAPSSVVRGSTVTIDVNYTSAADCDLIVYFRNNGVFSSPTRFSLTAGTDVTTPVEIVIDAEAPLGDGYEYAIFLTETGGEWGTRIGNGINTPASVVEGLIAYEAPSSVVPGSTVTIDVNYTSAVDCDLIVYFRNNGVFSSPTRFSLTAGTDVTTPVDIVINAEAPLGDGYEYAIFLTETGGEWGTRIGNGINTPASVIDGLIAYEAPDSVAPGSTVTIDVNYTSAVDCDLIVYFRNDGVYASPTRFSLTAGTNVTTPVEIVIDAGAPLGDGYEYAIFLTETGGEWGTRIGNGINTPASVVEGITSEDGLIGYDAPSSVAPGSTVTINVNYTSAVDCDLIVYFRDGAPYNTPETQRFQLTAGTDVTTAVDIVIKADAPPGDTYEYAIFLTETGGEWGTKIGDGINTPASVVDESNSATTELTNQFDRISYPTASSHLINFKTEVKTVHVVNLSGQVVLSKAGSAIRSIDISSLQNSVYIIVIDNNKCEKIMKN